MTYVPWLIIGMLLGMGLKEVLKASSSPELKCWLPIVFLAIAIGVGLTGRYMPTRVVATCMYGFTAIYVSR